MLKLNVSMMSPRRQGTKCIPHRDSFASLPFIIFHLLLPSALSLSFNISKFDDNTNNIFYEGDAKADSGAVHMTKSGEVYYRVGRFTYSKPVYLWDRSNGKVADFSTHFTFTIDTPDHLTYGDGLAFFIAPVGYGIPPNSGGGYLGLLNDTMEEDSQHNQIIIVEFDTYYNKEYDPPNAHVGININSMYSAAKYDWDAFSGLGRTVYCSINYNAATKNLSVSWKYDENKRNPPLFYVIDDIKEILPPDVSIGFSAATGLAQETHVIHSWDFSSNLEPNPGTSSTRKKILTSVAVAVACLLAFMIGAILVKRIRGKVSQRANSSPEIDIEKEALPKKFTYKDLVTATNGFADDRKLGRGGSGHVYKGTLNDLGCLVAIKRIIPESQHSEKFFTNEVKIISRLIHQNLVRFIGWCHEKGEFLLVYECMSNGSLDSHLFGERKALPWEVRYKIALGLASALHYLHEEVGQCVIHRDIKAANVLLDIDFTTKLGDFGVAKLIDPQLRTQLTGVVGTYGYLAPEYMNEGRVSKGSDIYSFGIVVLEIASGRKTYMDGECHMPLLKWVWRLYLSGNLVDAADERLNMVFNKEEMECLLIVGLWCTHPNDKERPKVGEVIKVLKFEAPLPELSPDMHDQRHYVPRAPQLLPVNPFTPTRSSSSRYQSA